MCKKRPIFILFALFASHVCQAKLPMEVEADFSDCMVQFNDKKFPESLGCTDKLIQKHKINNYLEFYELKALNLKNLKREPEAEKFYLYLISQKKNEPIAERAPYEFELGIMRFNRKDKAKAYGNFLNSIKGKYNEAVAHFYAGLIDFERARYDTSEDHFSAVLKSNIADLKVTSYFYIAQIYLKTKYPTGALIELQNAKLAAIDLQKKEDTLPEMKNLAKQIETGSTKALEPLDRTTFFGNVSLLTGYDSNALSTPDSITSAQGSNQGTIKESILVGAGISTSPTRTFQFVPSYRASFNYNFNQQYTRSAQFFAQGLSMYLNYKPLNRFTWGIKGDVSITFQNVVATDNSATYRPFLTQIVTGAYAKYEIFKKTSLLLDLSTGPQIFMRDSESPATLARTGSITSVRLSLSYTTGNRFFNPSLSLNYTLNPTNQNSQFSMNGYGASLMNTFYLTEKLKSVLSADYSTSQYGNWTSPRSDNLLNAAVMALYQLNRRFGFITDFRYTTNQSTLVEQFQYNRIAFSGGVNLNF